MDLFQSIDAFLELDVVRRQLCLAVVPSQPGVWVSQRWLQNLVISLAKLLLEILLCSTSEWSNGTSVIPRLVGASEEMQSIISGIREVPAKCLKLVHTHGSIIFVNAASLW